MLCGYPLLHLGDVFRRLLAFIITLYGTRYAQRLRRAYHHYLVAEFSQPARKQNSRLHETYRRGALIVNRGWVVRIGNK